jgi:hypothetical protein
MSRRKNKSRRRQDGLRPAEPRPLATLDRRPLKPNPPRPRKALLFFTCFLLAAWIAFLIILAVRTVS